MYCLDCSFYDKNDPMNAWGTCEPQGEDFHATHECNLNTEEISELISLTGHKQ